MSKIYAMSDIHGCINEFENALSICGNHDDRVLAGIASLDNYNANYDDEKTDAKYTSWISMLPYYYETEKTFFVHAGIDEEYGKYWKYTTTESILLHKYPAQTGEIKDFNKKIVAGHI